MGCDAVNHEPDCDCDRGRDACQQAGPPDTPGGVPPFTAPSAICPECGAKVFCYSSPDGQQVWFDKIGAPWPKHPCMDWQDAGVTISSISDLFEFIDARMTPSAAMGMAAELIEYAMKGYRSPRMVIKPVDERLKSARLDLLDWMFRSHSMKPEHIVPDEEFFRIIDMIEAQCHSSLRILESSLNWHKDVMPPPSVSPEAHSEQIARFQMRVELMRRRLSIIAMIRNQFQPEPDDGLVEAGENVLRFYKRTD